MSMLATLRVVSSDLLTKRMPWPRSPARAKRRAAKGHPQHYRLVPDSTIYFMPNGDIVAHPAMVPALTAGMHGSITNVGPTP